MPVPGLSLLGLKRIRGFVSILCYINPTIIIIIFMSRVSPTNSKHCHLVCLTTGYNDPPVPRQPVDQSQIPPILASAYTNSSSNLSRVRLVGKHGEIGTGPQTSLRLCRLPVQPKRGQGQTYPRAMAVLECKDPSTSLQTHLSDSAADVPHRFTDSHIEAGPPRSSPHETDTGALEKQLEGTRDTKKGHPHSQVTPHSPKMVASGRKCPSRPAITPPQSCPANLYRCIKRRVGRPFRGPHCKGNLIPSSKQATHKISGTKGSLSGPKEVPRPLPEPTSAELQTTSQ